MLRNTKSRWALILLLVATTGCVERRLIVRSNPPGALLKIDDEEIGITPVSTSFVYYGTRKIQLVKDGYETLTLLQPIPPPWYEWPGVDLVSEHLVPGQKRDTRVLDYQLQPSAAVPTDQLLERGNQLRRNAHANVEAVPAPRAVPAPAPNPGSWPPPVQALPPPVQNLPPPPMQSLPPPPTAQSPLWPGQPGAAGPVLPAQPAPPAWQPPR